MKLETYIMEEKNDGLLINTNLGQNEEDLKLKTLIKNKKRKYRKIDSIRETWGINSSQKQKELINLYKDTKLDTSQDSLLGFINRSGKINKEVEKFNFIEEKENEENIDKKNLSEAKNKEFSNEKKNLEKIENEFNKNNKNNNLNFEEILEAIKKEEINLEKLEINKELLKEVIKALIK